MFTPSPKSQKEKVVSEGMQTAINVQEVNKDELKKQAKQSKLRK